MVSSAVSPETPAITQQRFVSSVSKHQMGLAGAVCYVVSSMIGSGIFVTPKTVLALSGSAELSLVIWAVAGLMATLGGLVYAELATSIRQNGADYAYLSYVNWRGAAFLGLWLNVWISEPGGLAILAKTFATYIVEALPSCYFGGLPSEAGHVWLKNVISVLVVTFFAWLNMYRVDKVGAGLQIASTATQVILLAGVIGAGAYHFAVKGLSDSIGHTWADSTRSPGNIVLAIYACQWSYWGWDTLNYGTEEVRNPKRNAPIAILVGTLAVCVVYILVNISFIAVLGKEAMLKSDAIAQTLVATVFGQEFVIAVPVVIGLVLFGTLNPTLFSSSRIYFAGSRDGQLPTFLATLHYVHKTPRAALITNTLLSVVMIFVAADIDWLINCFTPVVFIQKALSTAALIWIRLRNIPVEPDAVRFPVIFHICFLIICVALVVIPVYQAPITSGIGFGCIVGGIPVYFAVVRLKHKYAKLKEWDRAATIFVQKLLMSEVDVKQD